MDSLYIVIFALLVLVIIPGMLRRRRLAAVRHILNKNKKQQQQQREVGAMKELAKQFIGRECLIYTVMRFSNSVSDEGESPKITSGFASFLPFTRHLSGSFPPNRRYHSKWSSKTTIFST